jgi:hypothetical protein
MVKPATYTVLLAVLVASAALPVLAAVEEGWRYSYTYSLASDGRSVSGSVGLGVVRVYGDGRVRLRLESTFNDGFAVVEKDAPAQAFTAPRIPRGDIAGSYNITRRGVSCSLTVTEVGRGERTVGGRSYPSVVYALSGTCVDANRSFSVSASLEVLVESRVIYSLTGSAVGQGRVVTFSVRLADANFDLNSLAQATRTDMVTAFFPQLIASPSQPPMFLFEGASPTQVSPASKATPSEDAGTRVLLAGVAGLGAIAAVAVLTVRRRGVEGQGAVKPHYV